MIGYGKLLFIYLFIVGEMFLWDPEALLALRIVINQQGPFILICRRKELCSCFFLLLFILFLNKATKRGKDLFSSFRDEWLFSTQVTPEIEGKKEGKKKKKNS